MKQDCELIVTLPSLQNVEKVLNVFKNSNVSQARFNTGAGSPMDVPETVAFLKDLSQKHSKKLWIDIKGRQLRIIKDTVPLQEYVELNHTIEVLYPAKIYFRNSQGAEITGIKEGNKVYVSQMPPHKLVAGQSVNIIARDLEIEGYLTSKDEEYLEECNKTGMKDIMASFVEKPQDLEQIKRIVPEANIIAKIESLKGLQFMSECSANLMAARDDLYIETGQNYSMLSHLKKIIEKDSKAICASRIFTSLRDKDIVDFGDYSDLELMYNMGYRRFMLCDNVCNFVFNQAILAWENFING